ncbi:MAG: DUF2027 domain-containing protein [Tannerella sp.]|nr:DUF2027 domain-containing protein [Tannerella sp.]
MKIGDKVRFLNSVGGGVVRAFRGKNMVLVEDENGFDFPSLITECVVVPGGDKAQKNPPFPATAKPVAQENQKKEPHREMVTEETPEGEKLNVMLAYLPVDPKSMIDTGFEAYFVNESNYYLSFNYMNRNNNSWNSRYQGVIEPNTKMFIDEFEKQELNTLERICIQLIAYKKDKPFLMKSAYSVELRLDTVKFYKLHCFTDNDYFDEDALIFPVIRDDVPEKQMLVSAAEIQEAMIEKKSSRPRVAPLPARKKKKEPSIIEVDLHIEQLLDTTQGMNAVDILDYQMDVFRKTLKKHAGKRGRKIVFIHGKGKGMLRAAIEKELKTNYKSYQYQDASFQEYGFGATMVKIR